jgi:hypothetical protein
LAGVQRRDSFALSPIAGVSVLTARPGVVTRRVWRVTNRPSVERAPPERLVSAAAGPSQLGQQRHGLRETRLFGLRAVVHARALKPRKDRVNSHPDGGGCAALMRSGRRLEAALTSPALPRVRPPARGGPMLDLLYLLLFVALFAISIAMIRFFDRL